MLRTLLKKQAVEKLSAFRKGNRRTDWLGAFVTLLLAAGLIAVCVIVLSRFLRVYSEIRMDGVLDVTARHFEILTLTYEAIFLLGIASGVKQMNFALFESPDRAIFSTLPIKPPVIFYSKIITVYFKQLAVYAVTLIPVNLTFAAVTAQGAYCYVMTFVMCLLAPLLTLSVASVFCLPVYFIKTFFKSRYVATLVLTTAAAGTAFWLYSRVLVFVERLMTSGDIRFFFDEAAMTGIIRATGFLWPANAAARMLLGLNAGANAGIFLGFTAGFAVAGYFAVSALYGKAERMRAVPETVSGRKRKTGASAYRRKSLVRALLEKEFLQIIRTPSYAFQYFSVAAVMPLMVYFCMGVGSTLLNSLLTVECNFELALLLVLVFSALTNTFCATNISREGSSFYTLKTMPVPVETVVGAKILFCSVVSALSSLIACVVVAATSMTGWGEAFFIFFVTLLVSEAQICFATRKDLNRPVFPGDDECEVKESTGTISQIIISGMLVALVLGAASLYLSVYRGWYLGKNSSAEIMIVTGTAAAAVFAAAVAYLLTGLRKKCYRISEGE